MGAIFGFFIVIYIITLIVLGFLQPVMAICRLLNPQRRDSDYVVGLNRYLSGVILYFAIIWFAVELEPTFIVPEVIIPFYLFVLPAFIAIWYIRFVIKWDKKHRRIKEFDDQLMLQVPCKERLELDRLPKRTVNIYKLKNGIKVKSALT